MEFDVSVLYDIQNLNEGVPAHQEKLVNLVSTLGTESGWPICASILCGRSDYIALNHMTNDQKVALDLLCCRSLEAYLRSEFPVSASEVQKFSSFLWDWLQINLQQPENGNHAYFRKKISQIICLGILRYFPSHWYNIFLEFLQHLGLYSEENTGPRLLIAADILADMLIELDTYLVSRASQLTPSETSRANDIKDGMRASSVGCIVSSSYNLLVRFANLGPPAANQVKKVLMAIGLLAAWVDLSYLANPRWLELSIRFLVSRPESHSIRAGVYSYLTGLVKKGMPTPDKLQLVRSVWDQLEQYILADGCLSPKSNLSSDEIGDECFEAFCCLGSLVNSIGLQLINVYRAHLPQNRGLSQLNGCGDVAASSRLVDRILEVALRLLCNSEENVSQSVIPFLQSYAAVIKESQSTHLNGTVGASNGLAEENDCIGNPTCRFARVQQLLSVVALKLKSLPDEEDDQDSDYEDYRHDLRTLLGSVIVINPEAVLQLIIDIVKESRHSLQLNSPCSSSHVNTAIDIFQLFGDTYKASKNDHFSQSFAFSHLTTEIMNMLCDEPFSNAPDCPSQLKYFEVMVRFERYFNAVPNDLFPVMLAFMDKRGLRSQYSKVRIRCSYLITRLLKNHTKVLVPYTEQIMYYLSPLLVLDLEPTPSPAAYPDVNGTTVGNQVSHSAKLDTSPPPLSLTEQGFLFEAITQLISAGASNNANAGDWFQTLLAPVLCRYNEVVDKFVSEQSTELAEARGVLMKNVTDIITRSIKAFCQSKAFASPSSRAVLVGALRLVVLALERLPPVAAAPGRYQACNGIRAFLHRMVSCVGSSSDSLSDDLSSMLLSALGTAMPCLVISAQSANATSTDAEQRWRELRDTIPLVNQIIQRYKERSVGFVASYLPPFLSIVLTALAESVDSDCMALLEEMKLLRRGYLQLLQFTCQTIPQCAFESFSLELLSNTLIQTDACISGDDPTGLRSGIALFTQIVEAGARDESFYQGFIIPSLVPFLVLSPTQPSFRLSDAQFSLAVNDLGCCLRALFNIRPEIADYLREVYLPRNQLCPSLVESYVTALKSHNLKDFQSYLRNFYSSMR